MALKLEQRSDGTFAITGDNLELIPLLEEMMSGSLYRVNSYEGMPLDRATKLSVIKAEIQVAHSCFEMIKVIKETEKS